MSSVQAMSFIIHTLPSGKSLNKKLEVKLKYKSWKIKSITKVTMKLITHIFRQIQLAYVIFPHPIFIYVN